MNPTDPKASMNRLPLIHPYQGQALGAWVIEAGDLKQVLALHLARGSDQASPYVIIDVDSEQAYCEAHIPGAIQLNYDELICGVKPATGKLPEIEAINRTLARLGLDHNTHVIIYDHENGARSGRLAWTLDMVGFSQWSWLNGGLSAWIEVGGTIETGVNSPQSSSFFCKQYSPLRTGADYIINTLNDPLVTVLDVRSEAEYAGQKSPSKRKGHIPGAVNLNWLHTIDQDNAKRLKSAATIENMLTSLGISRDNEVIVHCQTHQRSSHSYVMLKSLGFDKLRGYDGSWSEWGNRDDLPLETQ